MNRRDFIQQSLLLSGALALPSFLYALPGSKQISGKVTAYGRGIRNVVVSDGYNLVCTDKSGSYSFNSHELARFVFISIPSGYEFPHENSIAHFYKPIALESNFDFELQPLKKSDKNHQFILWADPQVRTKDDVAQMMATSVPDVQHYLNSLEPDTLIHGIGAGDLAWDNLEFFNDYNKAVELMGIPFFQVLGNHDMDFMQGGDETSDRTFQKFFGPTWYSFNRGKAHYVVLDDVRYLGTARNYDGFIQQHQLDWLKKDLAGLEKDQLLIISLHIPVHNGVKNKQALYDIVKEFKNVHILSGHTHYNQNVIENNVYEHNHGTVCGAWWTGPVCEDGTPRGYGIYEVSGNELKWKYKSTGLDINTQLSISLTTLTRQKRIIANVWNYDPEWKVEYYLDGKFMGILPNEKSYDPLTVRLYKGKDLPAGRGFPEPKLNDHMFTAHCSQDVKEVRVVATDRFGEKYEKTETFDNI